MTVKSWKPPKMGKRVSLLFAKELENAPKAPMNELNLEARALEKRLLALRNKKNDTAN